MSKVIALTDIDGNELCVGDRIQIVNDTLFDGMLVTVIDQDKYRDEFIAAADLEGLNPDTQILGINDNGDFGFIQHDQCRLVASAQLAEEV